MFAQNIDLKHDIVSNFVDRIRKWFLAKDCRFMKTRCTRGVRVVFSVTRI